MKYFHIKKLISDAEWVVELMILIEGGCLPRVYHFCVLVLDDSFLYLSIPTRENRTGGIVQW